MTSLLARLDTAVSLQFFATTNISRPALRHLCRIHDTGYTVAGYDTIDIVRESALLAAYLLIHISAYYPEPVSIASQFGRDRLAVLCIVQYLVSHTHYNLIFPTVLDAHINRSPNWKAVVKRAVHVVYHNRILYAPTFQFHLDDGVVLPPVDHDYAIAVAMCPAIISATPRHASTSVAI
jgi:hypothetical protein